MIAGLRVIAGGLLVAALLGGTTACLNTKEPVTQPAPPPTSTAGTATSPAPAQSSAAPSPTSDYPADARLYGESLLLAWRTTQFTAVGNLVTPDVLVQLQAAPKLEPNWAYGNCQGAAGSTYCLFTNNDGDAATIRVDNQLLGKAHAITEVKLDQTTYSNNATEYVKAFIEAWRNSNPKRMAVLANPAEVDYFTHYTPPSAYATCAVVAGGVANVRVFNSDGLNYTVSVSLTALGGQHAITAHLSTPAACT